MTFEQMGHLKHKLDVLTVVQTYFFPAGQVAHLGNVASVIVIVFDNLTITNCKQLRSVASLSQQETSQVGLAIYIQPFTTQYRLLLQRS